MSAHPASPGSMPAGRTGHACVQCRQRKQKCGGPTYGIKCRTCTTRKAKCSFEDEMRDPRYNPYLRVRSSRSPSASIERTSTNDPSLSSASGNIMAALHGKDAQSSLPPVQAESLAVASVNEELSRQVDSLRSRMADLERRLVAAQKDNTNYTQSPQSRTGTSFVVPSEAGTSNRSYRLPPVTSPVSFSNSDIHSLSSPQGATDGPLKTLTSIHTFDPVEFAFESHDPITRSILTEGEAYVMFRLYFSNCHPNAPFLDVGLDADLDRVRSSSLLLFLAILCIGARFWSASSKTFSWLHPRYAELIRLLDGEMMRVTLRPGPEDQKLETVQGLLLCAHWMPFDLSVDKKRHRSRFSEAGAWQCLGLAIRWATFLALERNCHTSFQHADTVTREDVRKFRTMLYLMESDHYLALSARRPSSLNPELLNDVLPNFLQSRYIQTTDIRLTALFRVAYGAHFTGCRPTTIESVEAFDKDVELIERNFYSTLGDRPMDALSQHFPFTSLRWYRLSYACAFLDVSDPTQRTGKALTWAIEWASQILLHLSRPPSFKGSNNTTISSQLEPDPSVVDIMSFAIDHYFVVIAYAAFFLVNSWLNNFIDLNLTPRTQQIEQPFGEEPSGTLLFRLVDVATRTLEAASCPEGHLARRYIPLLRRMTDVILAGSAQAQRGNGDAAAMVASATNLPDRPQGNLEDDLWEMWQQAGLEPIVWPGLLEDMYEG